MKLVDAPGDATELDSAQRLTRSKAYEQIGLAAARLGQNTRAASALAGSLELIEKLADESPDNAALREQTAAAHQNLGDASLLIEKYEDAERHFKKAIELRAAAVDPQSLSSEARRLLAVSNDRIANPLLTQKKYRTAMATNESSLSIPEPLIAEKPNDPGPRRT